jgi:hypothetical protein
MTEPMTPARFAMLAEAYGGVARWPAPDRAAGLRMARDPAAAALLEEAGRLDAVLDGWAVPAPSARLRGAVAAAMPRPAVTGRVGLWWSGIGIAAALAGAGAGAVTVALLAPVEIAAEGATSFGEVVQPEAPR